MVVEAVTTRPYPASRLGAPKPQRAVIRSPKQQGAAEYKKPAKTGGPITLQRKIYFNG